MMITSLISHAARFTLPSLIALALQSVVTSSASAAPLLNGGFESPDGPSPVQVSLDGNPNYVTGWVASGNGMFYEGPGTTHGGFTPVEGSYAVAFGFNNNTGSTLSQTFDTVAGQSYTIGYFVRRFGSGTAAQSMVAEAFDATNSNLLSSTATTFPSNTTLLQRTLVFTATSSSTRLQFRDTSAASSGTDNSFWLLDNVTRDYAATFTITTTNDTGAGSLREALAIAQSGDTIDFSVTGTITVGSTLLIDKSITILGPAAPGISISGNNAVRIFNLTGANRTITFSGLTIENGRIDQNAPGGGEFRGGAIFNQASGTLTLTNCTVANNTAQNTNSGIGYGGAIYNFSGPGTNLVLTDCVFRGNSGVGTGAGHGGAVYNLGSGTLTITRCTFTENFTESANGQSFGGAVFKGAAALTIADSQFTDNAARGASGFGGAVMSSAGGGTTISNSTFSRNLAGTTTFGSGSGGALGLSSDIVSISNSVFSLNRTSGSSARSGAIDAGTLTIMNSMISQNSATGVSGGATGGAILSGPLTVTSSTISENSVSSPDGGLSGGGAIQSFGNFTLNNVKITKNSVQGFVGIGAGIYVQDDGVRTITDSTISDNTMTASVFGLGGGFVSTGGTGSVTGSTFSGNTISAGSNEARGAGVYAVTPLTITNSTVSGNSATSTTSRGSGGGIYNAVPTTSGSLTVRHSTIVNNSATGGTNDNPAAGGGIFSESTGDNPPFVTLSHAIVAANTATIGPDVANRAVSQGYNLIGNGDGSTGLVNGEGGDQVGSTASPIDPKLSALGDYGGPTLTHALLFGSPAFNAGDPAFDATLLPTDQRGLPRVRAGRIDIGSYEAPPPPVITAPANGARTNGSAQITGTAEPGSTVVIRITTGSTTTTLTTTADSNGNFSVNASGLTTGDYTVQAGAGFGNEAAFATSNIRSFVVDATAPVISGFSNLTVEATGSNGAVVTYSPTATDNFDGNVPVNCSPVSGSTFAIGSMSVACSASDSVGNTSTISFTVTVQDTTAPTITVPGDIVVYNEAGKEGANVSFNVSATDTVDGSVTPTASPASGSLFPVGKTTVTVTATDSRGNTATRTFAIAVRATEMANISTRLPVGSSDNEAGIGGFIVRGAGARRVVVRAMGPSVKINEVPLANSLENPTLELYRSGSNEPIATNDDWQTSPQADSISAIGLAPGDARESALLVDLTEGAYTAVIRGAGGSTGNALVEVYAVLTDAPAFLGNISTRGLVQTGDNVLIGGVIVRGGDPERLLFRAIGPDLANRGVAGALQDPTLAIFNENGERLAFNDDWRENEQSISETNMPPSDDRESAVVQTLGAGNYTAVVRGKADTTGVGLVEVFAISGQSAQW